MVCQHLLSIISVQCFIKLFTTIDEGHLLHESFSSHACCVNISLLVSNVKFCHREDRRKTVERELREREERRLMNLEDLKQQQLLEAELRKLQNTNA